MGAGIKKEPSSPLPAAAPALVGASPLIAARFASKQSGDTRTNVEQPLVATSALTTSQGELSKGETLVQFLYRGNLKNFGLASAATGVAVAASSLSALALDSVGASILLTSSLATAAGYVWYPAYVWLSDRFQDKAVIKAAQDEGVKGTSWRIWGSRITQAVLMEGLWIGLMVPGQLLLRSHYDIGGMAAAFLTHVPAALATNLFTMNPMRNASNWAWGLDRPRKG